MKKLLLLIILSFFSAQSFAGSCPDGSEPVKSISDDGTYFVYNCGGNDDTKSSNSLNSELKSYEDLDLTSIPKKVLSQRDTNSLWNAYKTAPECFEHPTYGKGFGYQLKKISNNDFKKNEWITPFFKLDGDLKHEIQLTGTIPKPIVTVKLDETYGEENAEVNRARELFKKAAYVARIGNSDLEIQKVKTVLLDWAKNDALKEGINVSWGDKPVDWQMMMLINAILTTTATMGENINAEERQIIGPWLNGLVQKVAKSNWKDRQDNKAYLTSYMTLIWGLMVNDLNAVQNSIDVVKLAIHDMRPDGSLPIDTQRSGMGIKYNSDSFAYLLMMASILEDVTGKDLFSYKADGRSLLNGVNFVIKSVKMPSKTNSIYAISCPGGGDRWGSIKNPSKYHIETSTYLLVYAYRFPNDENSDYLINKYGGTFNQPKLRIRSKPSGVFTLHPMLISAPSGAFLSDVDGSNNTNSIKIPFNKGSNYSYKVNQNRVLLTDLDKYDYSNCKYTVEKNLFRNPLDSSSFLKKHSYLAIPDLETLGVGEQDIDEVTNTFAENLYKLHHACLSKDQNACKTIHKVVDLFSGNLALTKNNDNSNYHKHDELSWYHHEIVYHSINNILMPLMLSYSTANQALGVPKNHSAIGDWFKETLYRNLYNPKPLANEMPIQRCMLRNTDYVAANHTLAASSLVMLYGVTWDDQHAFNLGIEGFYSTLNSVRLDGSMSFEARRGANAMFYSGGTLSQLLKIYQVALNQGIVLDKVHSLHRAAKFLLDVVEDQTIIYKYAKGDAMAWCSEDYKEQCFTETGPRTASFGWVKHYMRLFPEHQNTKRIEAFANELATSDVITEKRKRSLNSVIKGHFPTELFRKNVVFDRHDKEYQNEYVFEDSLNWNSGSPMCLYDTVNISEIKKVGEAANSFDGSYAFIIRTEPDDGHKNIGTAQLIIKDGKISVARKYRYLLTSSTISYDTFEGVIDKEGNIKASFELNPIRHMVEPKTIKFSGSMESLQLHGRFDEIKSWDNETKKYVVDENFYPSSYDVIIDFKKENY